MKNLTIIITLIVLGLAGFYFFSKKPANEAKTPLVKTQQPEASNTKTMKWNIPPQMEIDVNKKYVVEMETSSGKMTIELFAAENPVTVNNFVFLSRQGFYNDTKFHRIIKDFMIQGGDPSGDGTGGPGYRFEDEAITRDYERGIVAMANAGPNTNGSQFFIMHNAVPLPKNYVIFGKLIDGLETLDKISETPVRQSMMGEEMSDPVEDIIIKNVIISEK